jgi:hypothetical protein
MNRALDDANEVPVKVRAPILQRCDCAPCMGPQQLVKRRRVYRKIVRDEMVQQNSEAVDIAPNRCLLSRQYLRRQVHGGSHQPATLRIPRRLSGSLLAGPKIHQHETSALLAHDILGLDVSMQEAGTMDGGKRATERVPNQGGFPSAERPMAIEHLL